MLLIARQNRYLRKFAATGAVARDHAKTLREVGVRDSRLFRRLVHGGIFVEAQPGHFYLDPAAGMAYRQRRRQQALMVLAVVVGAALVALLVLLLFR
jgi:hypothetical protein